MEEAASLGNYLPLSFKSPKEQEYIELPPVGCLQDELHPRQVPPIRLPGLPHAHHELVYFNIWQIKQTEPRDFEKGLIGFNRDVEQKLQTHSKPVIEHF